MLKFKIKETLEASGIQYPAKWLVSACGFSKGKAYKLVNNKIKALPLHDWGVICNNLHCTLNEIVYWDNEGHTKLPNTHPLMTNLSQPEKDTNWFKLFKHMTPDEIVILQNRVRNEMKAKNIVSPETKEEIAPKNIDPQDAPDAVLP